MFHRIFIFSEAQQLKDEINEFDANKATIVKVKQVAQGTQAAMQQLINGSKSVKKAR